MGRRSSQRRLLLKGKNTPQSIGGTQIWKFVSSRLDTFSCCMLLSLSTCQISIVSSWNGPDVPVRFFVPSLSHVEFLTAPCVTSRLPTRIYGLRRPRELVLICSKYYHYTFRTTQRRNPSNWCLRQKVTPSLNTCHGRGIVELKPLLADAH